MAVQDSETSTPTAQGSRSPRSLEAGLSHDQDEKLRQNQEQHPDESEKKDPFEVNWEGGDDDPKSPRSLPKLRKWMIVAIICSCSLSVTAASSIFASTYEQIEAEFHNSREVSTLGLSLMVLGISLGPMFLSPMSEFWGRRPIYIVSWTVYLIWLIPAARAPNIATLLVSRFFTGFAGSAFLAVAGGSIGDMFSKAQLQAPMAFFTISPFIGPSLGPLIGGFINYNTNWRWTWYVWIIFSFVQLMALIILVPETYHPIVLRNKARALRKSTGDDRHIAPTEKVQRSVISALGHSLLRPFQLLFFEWMVLNLCLFSAILLGTVYLFFGAFPIVFGNVYGFNLWQNGLTFIGLLIGMILGIATDPIWHRIREKLIRKLEAETGVEGDTEPEFRLPPTIAGSFLCPIGLFMFGWTAYASVHWIVPIIGSAIFGAGCVLSFMGIFTFLVDAYPAYAASALAANAFARCMFATAFPLFGDQMFNTLNIHWASSLLAFLTLAMVPFPYIFFKYGKRLRAKSSYAKD